MEDKKSSTQLAQEQEQQEQTAQQKKQERQNDLKPPKKFHFKKTWLLDSKLSVFSALKTMAFLAIVLWAYREGLFDQVPGIKELLEVGLNVGNEVCGFLADLLTKLYELLNIESIWHFIRSLVK